MSITIVDIMKLPSMKEARIVAGNPENKIISSITVLEGADSDISIKSNLNNQKYGSEIAITAFMSARNNIEEQCAALKRLYEEGDIGAIIYYLGIIVKVLDKRVIEFANKLDFVLIVMPKNRSELRYSDAISEIMELIVKDRLTDTYFAPEIIKRISLLKKNQRSINSVLRILSDRTQCSFFIIDGKSRILNGAEWPVDRGLPIKNILIEYNKDKIEGENITYISKDEKEFWVFKTLTCDQGSIDLYLLIVKEVNNLTIDICRQSTDVLNTYLNLWTDNYGEIEVPQLVNAILKDEPEKMQRIAEILHINISKLSYMYIFNIKHVEDSIHYGKELIGAESIIKDYISGFNNIFLTSIYEKDIVIFIDRQRERIDERLNELIIKLNANQLNINVSIFETILTSTDAKKAYELNLLYRNSAAIIFKEKKIFKSAEINFAKCCEDICLLGEEEVINRKGALRLLSEKKNSNILIETLLVFMLDGDMNIAKTAELMYLHKNTIKYRVNCLKNIFENNIYDMPKAYELYLASALERLLPTAQ